MKVSIEVNVPDPKNDRPGLLLRFPFDEDVNGELKSEIPWGFRRYVPELEGWWVAADYRDAAEDILRAHFGSLAVLGDDGGDYVVDRDGSRTGQGGLFE